MALALMAQLLGIYLTEFRHMAHTRRVVATVLCVHRALLPGLVVRLHQVLTLHHPSAQIVTHELLLGLAQTCTRVAYNILRK